MPIIKSAAKKLRHDRVVTVHNQKIRSRVKLLVKKARKTPSRKTLSSAFSALDRAAKKHIIHKNKVARLKSRMAKLLVK